MVLIESNNYGDIFISNEEVKNYIKKYLNHYLSFKINLDSIVIVESKKFYPVIKILINDSQKCIDSIIFKSDIIAHAIEVFLDTNIGLKISAVQVGINFDNEK